jgi:superfamily II DNA/RNA helicase
METKDILQNLNFSQLSEMQRNAVELIRNNANAVVLAPTGTGKTLAFLIPLAESIDTANDAVQAVVLSPTRELAIQTCDVLRRMKTPCRALCCYGGRPAMAEHKQIDSVKPQIVIATPGRLNDHIDKGNIDGSTVRTLVIDEFDKMLELKFQDEVAALLDKMAGRKRCILVSATDMKEIPEFAAFKRCPPATLNYLDRRQDEEAGVRQYIVRSPQKDKLETLGQLLCSFGDEQSIVFAGYRESVERIAHYLHGQKHSVAMFHGGMEQQDRETALSLFRNHSVNVLVSTDLAARGIDVSTLQNIVHYHLPANAEALTHRSGRSGRWEATGASYTILGPEEKLPDFYTGAEDMALSQPQGKPAKPQWTTLSIGRSKKDKLNKTDIVGFLCKTGGLKGSDIGGIDIYERRAYVAVRQSVVQAALNNIAGEKIKKMSTRIEPIRTSRLVPSGKSLAGKQEA